MLVYIYKAEILSVRHADNSAYIDLSTVYHYNPIILLLQVCHRELMQ